MVWSYGPHSVVYLSENVRLRLTDEHDQAMAEIIDEGAAYGQAWDGWRALSSGNSGAVTLMFSLVRSWRLAFFRAQHALVVLLAQPRLDMT